MQEISTNRISSFLSISCFRIILSYDFRDNLDFIIFLCMIQTQDFFNIRNFCHYHNHLFMSDSSKPSNTIIQHHDYIIDQQIYNKHIHKLSGGFWGRWIRNRRVSLMIIVLILFLGGFSAYRIPKESSPSISFGIIGINTIYPGVNSIDIDNLITDRIE